MKAIIFSDLHIHKHKRNVERLDDCLEALDWVFQETIKNNCEYLFFLGDLFHDRYSIDIETYYKTTEVLLKYLSNPSFKMYMIVGNHDMYKKDCWNIYSTKPFSSIPNLEIIDEYKRIIIDNVAVDLIPYLHEPTEFLINVSQNSFDGKRVLMTHLAVQGAIVNSVYESKIDVISENDVDLNKVPSSIFKSWNKTFLGHYHIAQELEDNVEYVGSPLEISFSEAHDSKHIILFDFINFEKDYIVNNFSSKHVIVKKDDIEKIDFNNKFVKIIIDNETTSNEIIDIKNYINRKYDIRSFDIDKAKDFGEKDEIGTDEQDIENIKSIFENEDEMLKSYMEETGCPEGLDKDLLFKFGKEICSKADEVISHE